MHHPLMCKVVRDLDFTSVCEFGNQRYGGPGGFKSTKEFYESLGCTHYVALDVNEDKDATIADLNYPIDLGETFDLVTNNGTSEHVFDQCAVFRNAHNLSHKWMAHVLPMVPWLNHGFYNFQPILFRDLAAANNYDRYIYIGNRWGDTVMLADEELFPEKRCDALNAACGELMRKGGVFVVAVLKKTDETPEAMRLPFQGEYQPDIADATLQSRYLQS